MGREFFDHTGDVGVNLEAASLDELFREAALSFTEIVTEPGTVAARVTQRVAIAAPTLDDLLVDWLDELLYRFEVHKLLIVDVRVSVREFEGRWELEGEVQGEPADAARHPIKVLVKGITYHLLAVRQVADRWATAVVFDI